MTQEVNLDPGIEGTREAGVADLTAKAPVTHQLTVDNVHDGDTLTGSLTVATFLGQSLVWHGRVRLITVNAPELSTPAGVKAAQFVQGLIKPGDTVTTSAPRDFQDQYGRLLADIVLGDGSSLSQQLLDSGNAAPMDGKTATEEGYPHDLLSEHADLFADKPAKPKKAARRK